MTQFRPCIDLHAGKVKQIVGSSFIDNDQTLETNFESVRSASHFAELYRDAGLCGGHVIKLGPGNDSAARKALASYPNGLQVGGGISVKNAAEWIDAGASHVIVTSWLFNEHGNFLPERLEELIAEVGREHLVLDLSCRSDGDSWVVTMDRWQTSTNLVLSKQVFHELSDKCAEFLIHAADVEGKCGGMDERLVAFLGEYAATPITYAGGANSIDDLQRVNELSKGTVDLTIGSALDIFGGRTVHFDDCVAWNRAHSTK